MTDLTKIPDHVLQDAARNMGWQINDYKADYDPDNDPIEPYLKRLERESVRKIFNRYCEWQGLIGYGYDLWDTVVEMLEANED